MKQMSRVKSVIYLFAAIAVLMLAQCRPATKSCITPTPEYTIQSNGVLVNPGNVSGVTGVRMRVANAATDSVLLDQTIQADTTTLVPFVPGPDGLRITLQYLDNGKGKYCDHDVVLRTEGGPIMDVVMLLNGTDSQECTDGANKPSHSLPQIQARPINILYRSTTVCLQMDLSISSFVRINLF
ncbi:MAG: hypothetical protein IPL65_10495 [Lewinellaceae bacterium]|nr:hypothetical protein [Lewinellaceae bacterium]